MVLGAGCHVTLKASKLCRRIHHSIVEAFEEAELPEEVINQIQVKREDAVVVTEATFYKARSADNCLVSSDKRACR